MRHGKTSLTKVKTFTLVKRLLVVAISGRKLSLADLVEKRSGMCSCICSCDKMMQKIRNIIEANCLIDANFLLILPNRFIENNNSIKSIESLH